jgi:5-(carboxyamino)imidazole ribonucleotide synthase
MNNYYETIKLGIVGGGQLGRMLIQSAINFNITTHVLDPDNDAPCSGIAHKFYHGSLTDFDAVYNFGKNADVITIEIENVNCEALIKLEEEGKKVFPQPKIVRLIQDKGLQKEYFKQHKIPTADFRIIEHKEDLEQHKDFLPFFMKLRKEGYDGRGVQRIKTEEDFSKGFNKPSVLEKSVQVKEEISIIVARNESGEVKAFPAVGMEFHAEANLVELLYAPANVNAAIAAKAEKIALQVVESLKLVGILAIEMFVNENDEVLVNEIAPRPHNSGHHTIEANMVSQYEQHLRAILNLPLGSTTLRCPTVMVNLLGEENFEGKALYEGMQQVLKMPGVNIHLYGKKNTKPFRKMGHVTIVDTSLEGAKAKAKIVKETLKVKA